MSRRLAGKMFIFLLLITVCVGCENRKTTGAPASPAMTGNPPLTSTAAGGPSGAMKIQLKTVVPDGTFEGPVGIERRVGRPDKLYVVEQPGRIRLLDLAKPSANPVTVLDITDRVNDSGGEQGLLGLAFHPSKTGIAFVNYTTNTHTVISRFQADPKRPDRLDSASEQVLLTFRQPYANHNGGQLAFGPDGFLYMATGDGGSAGDPQGNSQNKISLLGKILRIDVDRTQGKLAYSIPVDNPFAKSGGAAEVYAYGLRNPWRFSFDSVTGKLWAADVGQNRLEEIDIVEKGGNYGWNIREGTSCYEPKEGCPAKGLIPPIHVYGRDLGVSVTGGFVYRGKQVPQLRGWYLYTDYATGTIWSLRQRKDESAENRTLLESRLNITSFGVDLAGEIYVCSQDGAILKIQPG